MQFLWSPFLWLIGLVPVLVLVYVWLQQRRRKYALRYASISLVKPVVTAASRLRRYLPPALFFIALVVMFLALARPYAQVRTPHQEGVIILALDSSLSMQTQDMDPNRFEAAKAAARQFIAQRGAGATIGIVAFAENAAIVQLPTDDAEQLSAAIDTLFLQRGTAIGEGILTSLQAISITSHGIPEKSLYTNSPAPVPTLAPVQQGTLIPAIIILLTDGENRNGIDPQQAAQIAAADGVRVYTIGVGSKGGGGGAPNQGQNFGGFGGFGGGGFRGELDEATLKGIADKTGGKYFYAGSTNDLEQVYSNIGFNVVLKLEKMELTVWFTAAAAILLFSAFVLSILWGTVN